MNGTLRLQLAVSATLHLATPVALPGTSQSSETYPSLVLTDVEFAQDPARANSSINVIRVAAPSRRLSARATMPLDVVFVQHRLYEPPVTLNFAVVTPFDADNREAGVELRCNSRAVASSIWTLDERSNTVREFHWKLTDENCLYELVVILTRAKDYLYLYQMVPSRASLSHRMPARQFGRGSRVN